MTITIPIISEFQGKGFKQAEKSAGTLEKGLKRLAVTLGAALSIRKITQFGKAASKAFIEEDRAVKALAVNLKNLGLAYDVRPVEDYITSLQYATGVADGELRPALSKLITSVGSLSEAQKILNLGLDISAGTQKSLTAVTDALARAYLGNNASLSRLNIGISKADLSSKSFAEITDDLTQKFKGQASAAAKTYAGQMDILRAAAGDAQETIGKGLVQALELLGGSQGLNKSVTLMQDLARFASDAALASAYAVKSISENDSGFLSLPKKLWLFAWQPFLDDVAQGAAKARAELLGMTPGQRISPRVAEMETAAALKAWLKQQRAAEKLRREQEKIAKAAKAARVEAERRAKVLEKLGEAEKTFDEERISIAAALKNESLDRNEILRLELKKAIINENADRAEKLADQLAKSQQELAALQALKLANPFQAWEDSLAKIRSGIGSIGLPVAPITPQGTIAGQAPELPSLAQILPPGQSGYIPPSVTQEDLFEGFGRGSGVMAPQINITVQGTGDLSDDTKKAVVDAVVEASARGYGTGWFRTTDIYAI